MFLLLLTNMILIQKKNKFRCKEEFIFMVSEIASLNTLFPLDFFAINIHCTISLFLFAYHMI